MARMRVLDLAKPFAMVLPEVQFPYQRVDQMERLVFTVCAVALYVLLAEVPLYTTRAAGAAALAAPDPIAWLRPALAMAPGSPLELGVLPLLVSGFAFQLAAGLRRLNVGLDLRAERALFQSAQKLVALAVAAVLAAALAAVPGAFGAPHDLSIAARALVAAQIFGGSVTLVFLDEVVSKGYGIGTGIVLFTSARAAQAFVWAALSLQSVDVPGVAGAQTYGAIPSLVWDVLGRSFSYAVSSSVFRSGLPNILDVSLALAVFFGMLYLATIRVDLQIRSTKVRGQSQTYPVRLIYTGVLPVLFVTAVLATFLLLSYALSAVLGSTSPVAQVLGAWDLATARPVAGIASFLVPHASSSILLTAARAAAYLAVYTALGAWFAGAWVRASGFAPADVAKQFKENNIVLVGKRDVSVAKELGRIIPLAATLGGAVLGAAAAAADLLGGAGWGSTIAVAALNAFTIFELLASEGMVGPNSQLPMM